MLDDLPIVLYTMIIKKAEMDDKKSKRVLIYNLDRCKSNNVSIIPFQHNNSPQ